ncbi:uncharacterized protein [Macrobrachium rosenbergii]|uniref:uncharacterized protein n=1 Tax=Macrobrachium rosenbergii TaxID=79674 RepID=UPI0034D5D3B6
MLRTVAQALKRQYSGKYLHNLAKAEKFCPFGVIVLKKPNVVPVCCYSTKTAVSEQETLSYKVLEHIRGNVDYVTSPAQQEKQFPLGSVSDMKYAIKKALLLIAHNPEVKVSEILQLFSMYASSGQFVMQDIISNKTLMKSVQSKVMSNISLMNVSDMRHLAVSLRELENQKIGYLSAIRGHLANQCKTKAVESELSEVLQLFDVLLILFGNNVYKRKEYETFISLFESFLSIAEPHELVQILHYVGLSKKKSFSKEFIDNIVKKLEPRFSHLSFCDAGICVSGIFKSGVNLDKSSHLVHQTVQHLQNRMKESCALSDLESFAFVSMIKVLRTAKYENDEFFSDLGEYTCKMSEVYLTPQVVPHILALYANSRIYEKELFCKLEQVTLEHLKDHTSNVRVRDISRLLWCFSHTGHGCNPQLFTLIDKYLSFIHGSQINKDHHFSDSLLSLVICGHYPEDLIKLAFMPTQITGLRGHQRSKQLSRLVTLYESLKIEAPELNIGKPQLSQGDLPMRTLSDEIQHRPGLSKVMEGARCINEILGANVLKLKFLIPSINYANLIVDFDNLKSVETLSSCGSLVERNHILGQLLAVKDRTSNLIAIELLEPQFLIKPSLEPTGFIRLKLRLLRHSGWDVKILSHRELEECGDDTRAIAALVLDKVTS